MQSNFTNKNSYSCKKYQKWIKIKDEMFLNTPFRTNIIKCSKCKSYAFLNFVHEEIGDYYGPNYHDKCEGIYVYLCTKNKSHVIETEDDEL